MKVKRVDHIGVLVADLDKVKRLYAEVLGLPVRRQELYQGIANICFLPVGDTQFELVGDVRPDGEVMKVIAEHGEGIDHIALEVEDIYQAIKELKARGIPVLNDPPKDGAEGTKVTFLDSKATYGVSIELVQAG